IEAAVSHDGSKTLSLKITIIQNKRKKEMMPRPPATAGAAHPATGAGAVQTEAMKQILGTNDKGERLNQDQLDAISKYQEVTNNLEFAKELHRSFMALSQDIQKTIKKTARGEQLKREELQYVLDKLGDDEVRTDLKQGLNGVPILSKEELSLLDEFCKLEDPKQDVRKEKSVCGTSYKVLKDIVKCIFQSNYFDSTHNHQNGLCEEEEAAPTVEDQVAEAEPELVEDYTEQNEYVNRQFMAETQFTSGEKEQVDEWTIETVEVVNSPQQQPQASSPSVPEPHSLTPVAQGPYNFIQDSVLDFENQTLDPAIVSAQPVNPAQNMDMPQLVCPPVHSESKLAQPNQVPVQPEATQVPLVSSTSEGYIASQPLYQPSPATEQQPQKEPIDQIQATISLNTDQTTPQVFQAGTSKPLHSGGINVNAAPFQSMQIMFNMNQNQYQASYNQSFSSQPHQVEQTELHQEQLQTVVGTYHGFPDQSHQVTGNHQQPPQQNTGFPHSSQPYTIAVVGLMNGYQGPADGFRGGYYGYQSQFSAPWDYSGYQRDGYQQNFNGPWGAVPPRPANVLYFSREGFHHVARLVSKS
uniref:Caprin-1 dimerization domain-containing protein n=1 Tax=Aotus nancymaae TaxID=37293 RepID=A0A2K5EK62_AOTNA